MIRYVVGSLGLGIAITVASLVAWAWCRRLLPGSDPVTAMGATTVLSLVHLIVPAQLVGVVGAFRPLTFVGVTVVLGAASSLLVSRIEADPADPQPPGHVSRMAITLSVIAVLGVSVAWVSGSLAALNAGPFDVDSQYYHLPHAATFAQSGSLFDLHFVNVDDAAAYHPMNAELLHAIGMLLLGSDVLTPILNLFWLLLASAGAWSVGRALGSGPMAMASVSLVLATPLIVRTQAGTAHNDVAGLALLLVAVGLLLARDADTGAVVVAGLACGLALGTKLTNVVPVAALTVVLTVLQRRRRWQRTATWLGCLVAAGGFWYAKNLVRTGNPVPTLKLGIGDVALPRPPIRLIDRFGFSVSDYLTDVDVWRTYFVPGALRAFGRAWPVVVVLAIAGIVITLVRGSALVRGVAIVAIVSAVGYAVTPSSAYGPQGQPILFAENIRYAAPALGIGLALFSSIASVRRLANIACAALAAFVGLTVAGSVQVRLQSLAAVAITVAAATLLAVIARGHRRRLLAAGLAMVAVVAGYPIQERYLDLRYREMGNYRRVTTRDPTAFFWAQDVSDARIAIAGFYVQYPLYGADLSNEVVYVGERTSDGAFIDYRSCRAWVDALAADAFDYVVLMGPFGDSGLPPQARWTEVATTSEEIVGTDRVAVFKVGPRRERGCETKA